MFKHKNSMSQESKADPWPYKKQNHFPGEVFLEKSAFYKLLNSVYHEKLFGIAPSTTCKKQFISTHTR